MRTLSSSLVFALVLGAASAAFAQESPGTRAFNVDPAASSVHIRVFRAGVLSALAHDHVINAVGIAGRVLYDPAAVTRSSLQLSIPVGSLVVDHPDDRQQEGLDGTLDEDDIAEIRAIVLSRDYLDEAQYPRVVITTVSVQGELPLLSVGLNVRIRQVGKMYTVPVQVTLEGGLLRATGEMYLNHSDFGMKPYRALLGAIAVQDPVLVKFAIVASEQLP